MHPSKVSFMNGHERIMPSVYIWNHWAFCIAEIRKRFNFSIQPFKTSIIYIGSQWQTHALVFNISIDLYITSVRMRMDVVVAYTRQNPGIFLKGVRKTTKNVDQGSRSPGWILNKRIPEWEARTLTPRSGTRNFSSNTRSEQSTI